MQAGQTRSGVRSNYFAWRKLHSLAGVIPVGAFLIEHLISNLSALGGPDAYNRTVAFLTSLPGLVVIETLFIYIPILFHGVWGLWLTRQATYNLGDYPYARNYHYILQRVSGVITFFFIAYHVWTLRLAGALFGRQVSFAAVAQDLSSLPVLVFYVLGVMAAAYHFANGLWLFGINWGFTIGPRAQRVSGYVSAAVFLALSAAGLAALSAFV